MWRKNSISVDGTMDDLDNDEKDECKRKSRNLLEKKRRDQFNTLVTELGVMVNPGSNSRKMDKTTVLKTTISFLKQHNEQTARSQAEEIKEDWKPPYLSNEEFTHLMLESLDGFIVVLGTDGHILYTSESLSSLLGYMPSSLHNTTLYEILGDGDKIPLYNHLNMSNTCDTNSDNQLHIQLHIRRSAPIERLRECETEGDSPVLELVQLSGYFRKWVNGESGDNGGGANSQDNFYNSDDEEVSIQSGFSVQSSKVMGPSRSRSFHSDKTVFVATGRLLTPQLIRELPVVHQRDTEFTSKHSFEWKFLYLDHRAPPIIGYLPFELLGTSGYDYYHVDDLDQVAQCHELLRQTGECTSCFYRFLTKGQQWIWLQSRYYITYHQWNSKPEFINATHKVVNYKEVQENADKLEKMESQKGDESKSGKTHSFRSGTPTWSSKSSVCGSTGTGFASSSRMSQENNTNTQLGSYRSRYSGSSMGNAEIGGLQLQQDLAISESLSGMEDGSIDNCVVGAQQLIVPPEVPVPVAVPQQPQEQQSSLILTPAQLQLQRQLRSKHAELSRRIAEQQRELSRLNQQLLLTASPIDNSLYLPSHVSSPATQGSRSGLSQICGQGMPGGGGGGQVNMTGRPQVNMTPSGQVNRSSLQQSVGAANGGGPAQVIIQSGNNGGGGGSSISSMELETSAVLQDSQGVHLLMSDLNQL